MLHHPFNHIYLTNGGTEHGKPEHGADIIHHSTGGRIHHDGRAGVCTAPNRVDAERERILLPYRLSGFIKKRKPVPVRIEYHAERRVAGAHGFSDVSYVLRNGFRFSREFPGYFRVHVNKRRSEGPQQFRRDLPPRRADRVKHHRQTRLPARLRVDNVQREDSFHMGVRRSVPVQNRFDGLPRLPFRSTASPDRNQAVQLPLPKEHTFAVKELEPVPFNRVMACRDYDCACRFANDHCHFCRRRCGNPEINRGASFRTQRRETGSPKAVARGAAIRSNEDFPFRSHLGKRRSHSKSCLRGKRLARNAPHAGNADY
ncbi:MAG: hypothetical protein BWY06_01745 [Candidatus Latescibacteria bacterium ADurb.Bin168]|nr:MAG: hypothetical protein BWY06_01745 [Candidatus Latescibacteria bacterium ADurb.Bin168]